MTSAETNDSTAPSSSADDAVSKTATPSVDNTDNQQRLLSLIASLEHTEQSQTILVQNLQQELQKMMIQQQQQQRQKDDHPSTHHDSSPKIFPYLGAIESLLLSPVLPSNLQSLWKQAEMEWTNTQQHYHELDWTKLKDFIDNVKNHKDMVEAAASSIEYDDNEYNDACVATAMTHHHHNNYNNLARQSQLFQKLHELERHLQQQLDRAVGHNNDDDALLQQWIQEQAEQGDDYYQSSHHHTTTTTRRVCIDTDQLITMYESAKHSDPSNMRTTLERLVRDYDDTMDGRSSSSVVVILDAPLQSSSSRDKTAKGTLLYSSSLRQILDTPILQGVVKVVDTIVDFTSGYNDALDHYVDRTIEKYKSLHGYHTTLGQVVVHSLLEYAGRVPIPSAVSTVVSNSKAGILKGGV